MIKVTNNSARLYHNIGGQALIPGQTIEIDDKFLPDVKDLTELTIELPKVAGWGKPAKGKKEVEAEPNEE